MTTPNRVLQNAQAPGVALQHSIAGSPVQGVGGVNHAAGNVQRAGLHSTAPYIPPKRVDAVKGKQLCSKEGCKAYPMKKIPYCAGHAKSLGLVEWNNTPKSLRKDSNDDTERSATVGPTADGDDAS
jgi:hypothetical protein